MERGWAMGNWPPVKPSSMSMSCLPVHSGKTSGPRPRASPKQSASWVCFSARLFRRGEFEFRDGKLVFNLPTLETDGKICQPERYVNVKPVPTSWTFIPCRYRGHRPSQCPHSDLTQRAATFFVWLLVLFKIHWNLSRERLMNASFQQVLFLESMYRVN